MLRIHTKPDINSQELTMWTASAVHQWLIVSHKWKWVKKFPHFVHFMYRTFDFLQKKLNFQPKNMYIVGTWFHNYSCNGVGRVNSKKNELWNNGLLRILPPREYLLTSIHNTTTNSLLYSRYLFLISIRIFAY